MISIKKVFSLLTATVAFTAGAWAADAAAGKKLYEASCKKCHGIDGTPNAAIAKMMNVKMEHLGSKEVQAKSDAQLAKLSKEGAGKMKPVAISEADAANIVAHVRSFKQ